MSDLSAYKDFRERLKAARIDAGISQAYLAKRLDRHQTYVSLVELGQRHLDPLELVKWCMYIGADPANLVATLASKVDKPRARVKLEG